MVFLLKGRIKEILDANNFIFMIKNLSFSCWINSTKKIKIYEEIELYVYVFAKMAKKQIIETSVFAFKKYLDWEFFNKLLSLDSIGIKTAQKIICFDKEEIIKKLTDPILLNCLLKEMRISFKQADKLRKLFKFNDEIIMDQYYAFVSDTLVNLGYKKKKVNITLQKHWKQWRTLQIEELISLFAKKYIDEYSKI